MFKVSVLATVNGEISIVIESWFIFGLIVQATPVGTVPNVSDVLPFPWSGLNDEHLVIDLIYNPTETLFLHRAKSQGATVLNGKDMLFNQAQAAWEWWNQSK